MSEVSFIRLSIWDIFFVNRCRDQKENLQNQFSIYQFIFQFTFLFFNIEVNGRVGVGGVQTNGEALYTGSPICNFKVKMQAWTCLF